uniref:DNA binding protein n=1 Tax=Zea mays TaxID=4577 RepID=A0A804M7B8_MAIZE
MSRCFPFPPPRYEKTVRPDAQLASQQQQLDKEKHKEKKHKKDKKDKDRKEGKEKKDKDRSRDKHKDKKDRKEKHKDEKKDKSKDKNRESGEGIQRNDEALHGQKVGESSRGSEEIKDLKFREELVRGVQDEKGAASQTIENYAVSNDRNRKGFIASPAMETERSAHNKVHIQSGNASRKTEGFIQQSINANRQKNGTSVQHSESFTTSARRTAGGFPPAPTTEDKFKAARLSSSNEAAPRKEGVGQRISNISISLQKRTENTNKDVAKKEVGTSSPLPPNPANAMHKGNGKVGRPMDNTQGSMQRFGSPSTSSATWGMDRGAPRSSIPSPSITIRRPNGMVRPAENLSVSAKKPDAGGLSPAMGKEKEQGGRLLQANISTDQKLAAESRSASAKKPDAGGLSPAMGKEKEQGGRLLQANISTDQKLVMSKPPAVEKAADGRAERMEKVRDGAPDIAKKEDKKSDRHEKKKRKEKDKHKEKKKEKEAKKEKREHNHKEHNKTRENSISYPIDSLNLKHSVPPLAPPVDDGKSVVPDENLKKRKNHETNGYLQNNLDMRPTKLPRPALPSNRVENGTASHVAAPLSSVKQEAINIEKAERLHKEEKVNGNQQGQQRGPVDPVAAYENGTSSRKPPHPDCKYLSQIYSIPEAPQMMELPGQEGEDWLFDKGGTQPRKPASSAPEADGVPQVWAQALKIDHADVIALPYVIPF